MLRKFLTINLMSIGCITSSRRLQFRRFSTVPEKTETDFQFLRNFIMSRKYLVCITGAGISTESGIPDYRGASGSYSKGHKPMVHSEFMGSEHKRKRYWARSTAGWQFFLNARPNHAHFALSQLEHAKLLKYTITQNVDRLHQKAGSANVLDLHGRNDITRCMSCHKPYQRRIIQEQLVNLNPDHPVITKLKAYGSLAKDNVMIRSDGDAEVGLEDYSQFRIPCCPHCGGFLKPDVVFFGDSVPAERVHTCNDQIDRADGVLVVGSSLEVYSAYRLVSRASSAGLPIAVLNIGPTRAERSSLPNMHKIDENCAPFLKSVVESIIT